MVAVAVSGLIGPTYTIGLSKMRCAGVPGSTVKRTFPVGFVAPLTFGATTGLSVAVKVTVWPYTGVVGVTAGVEDATIETVFLTTVWRRVVVGVGGLKAGTAMPACVTNTLLVSVKIAV